MVAFGRQLRQLMRPEWTQAYIDYELLKQLLKQEGSAEEISAKFTAVLDAEIEEVALHSLKVQGQLAARVAALLRVERGTAAEDERVEMSRAELAAAHREVAWDVVEVFKFIEVSVTTLRKALKKRDKQLQLQQTAAFLKATEKAFLEQTYHPGGIDVLLLSIRHAIERNRDPEDGQVEDEEDVMAVLDSWRARLGRSTWFLSFLGSQAAFANTDDLILDDGGNLEPVRPPVHLPSLWLNLLSTGLYMCSYYVVLPSSGQYAKAMGADSSLSGMVIGMTPLAACAATVGYSWWSNTEFKAPFLFCTALCMLGNIVYAGAYDQGSFMLVLLGRLMLGLGGGRALNRRYIADNVPLVDRTVYSAAFVTAGALGMAAGPLLAAFLEMGLKELPSELPLLGSINSMTAPGWLMVLFWALFLLAVAVLFEEPPKRAAPKPASPTASPTKAYGSLSTTDSDSEAGSRRSSFASVRRRLSSAEDVRPLLAAGGKDKATGGGGGGGDDGGGDDDDDEDDKRQSVKPLALCLFIYFCLKLVLELVLSSAPVITHNHFQWDTLQVSSFVSCLSITVLPINYFVGRLSHSFADRTLVVAAEVATMFGLLVFLRYGDSSTYTQLQYIVGSCVTFVSVQVLEGVNMSLLSKIVPKRLARGLFNAGFLATEAGTAGRAFGDIYFAVVGVLTNGVHVIDPLFLPMAVLMAITLLLTVRMFGSLGGSSTEKPRIPKLATIQRGQSTRNLLSAPPSAFSST